MLGRQQKINNPNTYKKKKPKQLGIEIQEIYTRNSGETTHYPKRQKGLIGEVETGGKWERGTAEHNQDNQTGNKTQDTRGTGGGYTKGETGIGATE